MTSAFFQSCLASVRPACRVGLALLWLGLNTALAASESQGQTNAVASGTNSPTELSALSKMLAAPTNGPTLSSSNNEVDDSTNLVDPLATNPPPVLDDKYKLAIGDHLSFKILEDGDDPKPLWVTDSGDLEVPYIGRVPADGKTCRQLAADIKAALEKEYYYRATVVIAVDLMTKSHGRVYLVGAVREPGPVELPTDETLTVSRAILRAGGFTDYARRDKVTVTRKEVDSKDGKKTFNVDVGAIFDKSKIETDMPLQPDDLIFVPERLIHW